MAKHGPTLTDVLGRAYKRPFTTKSNYARAHINLIAMAACEGLITTRISGHYGSEWRITMRGLKRLQRAA